jgi:hypothetical protein
VEWYFICPKRAEEVSSIMQQSKAFNTGLQFFLAPKEGGVTGVFLMVLGMD